MTKQRVFDSNGTLLEETETDVNARTVTKTTYVEGGGSPAVETKPLADEDRDKILQREKEDQQLTALDTKYGEIKGGIDELRAYTRITVSGYRFDTVLSTEVDAREAARQINSLRQAVLDQAVAIRVLTRLVRNIAAADD